MATAKTKDRSRDVRALAKLLRASGYSYHPSKHLIAAAARAAFRNRALFELAWFCSALDTVSISPDNLP